MVDDKWSAGVSRFKISEGSVVNTERPFSCQPHFLHSLYPLSSESTSQANTGVKLRIQTTLDWAVGQALKG